MFLGLIQLIYIFSFAHLFSIHYNKNVLTTVIDKINVNQMILITSEEYEKSETSVSDFRGERLGSKGLCCL